MTDTGFLGKMDVTLKRQMQVKSSQSFVENYLLEKYRERRKIRGAKAKLSRHNSLTRITKEKLVGLHGVSDVA